MTDLIKWLEEAMDVAAVGYFLAGAVGGVVVLIMQAFAKWFLRRPTDTGRE